MHDRLVSRRIDALHQCFLVDRCAACRCDFRVLLKERVIYITWTGTFEAFANNADPDQTPHNAASDQSLHCLLKIQKVKC